MNQPFHLRRQREVATLDESSITRSQDSTMLDPQSKKFTSTTMIPLDLTTSIEIPPLTSISSQVHVCMSGICWVGQLQHAWTGISVSDFFFSSITSCRWLGYGVSTA